MIAAISSSFSTALNFKSNELLMRIRKVQMHKDQNDNRLHIGKDPRSIVKIQDHRLSKDSDPNNYENYFTAD